MPHGDPGIPAPWGHGQACCELGLTFKVFAASPKPALYPCNPASLLTDSWWHMLAARSHAPGAGGAGHHRSRSQSSNQQLFGAASAETQSLLSPASSFK